LAGLPVYARPGRAPDVSVGALRRFLDEVEEEAEFLARFDKPLKDVSPEELEAARDQGVFVGECWDKRPSAKPKPGTPAS
jgi:hypothetical protein